MKTTTTLLTLVLTAASTFTTTAQEVAGSWQAESVSSTEPPKGAELTLVFGEKGAATITYTLSGNAQSWDYTYAVTDGQLTLELAKPFGEPQTVTYDIKFDEGKLLLLTPKPEPVKDETDDGEEDEQNEEGKTDADTDAESDAEEAAGPEGADAAKEDMKEEASEKETEADAEEEGEETEEEEEEEEEEDTRVPVWVLVKA